MHFQSVHYKKLLPSEKISKEKESLCERVGRELQTSEQRTVRAKITRQKVGALPSSSLRTAQTSCSA